MWYTIGLIVIISLYEGRIFIKEKRWKDMAVFAFLAVLTLVLGLMYANDPMHFSFANMILDF